MFSKYSLKKPYTVLVGVVLVIVLGIVALSKMTTDLLPDMSLSYALIITTDVGASPEKVESEVTAPIESAIATTANIKNVTSTSYNSYSMVVCEYEQNANMDSVVIEIQQKLDQLKGQWSENVGTPMIMRINPDMLPVLTAGVDVDEMDALELSEYVENELIPSLESVEGVASVSATGLLEEKITVTLSQSKIDKLNEKVKESIEKQFKEHEKELEDAVSEVESGQKELEKGQEQLSDAVNSALAQRDELFKTEKDLEKQKKDLTSQKKSLEEVQGGINAFLKSEEYTKLQELRKGIGDLEKGVTDMQAGIQQLEGAIKQSQAAGIPTAEMEAQLAQLQAQLPTLQLQLEECKKQMETANAGIATQFAGLSKMGITVNGMDDLDEAVTQIGTMLTQVNAGMAAIDSGLEQVQTGKTSLSAALDTLNANAALSAIKMNAGAQELSSAAASLKDAQSNLDSAKEDALHASDMNNVITTDTITGILKAQNFAMPAGYLYDGDTQYLVRVGESVNSQDELKNLVLMDLGMEEIKTVKLSDVAEIVVGDNSEETYTIINGNPGVSISMEKQTGYSTGEVTKRVLEKFETLEKNNDKLHLTVLMDQGVYIDIIVKSVFTNMIYGAVLAIFVLLLFLKDVKPTIVIACSIPFSVITAVVLMYFTDISLNIISLSGLTLGIGMLVDNSIVVIENIYRLRSEGYSIKKAAVEGAGQVSGAIVASTLTTVSVYAPIIFTDGMTKQLFVDLALTIGYTLLASLIVALTFVPAMSSAVLKKTKDIQYPWFDRFKEWYARVLQKCLKYKVLVFILAIVLLIGSAMAAVSRGMIFMDMEMETGQLSVTVAPLEDQKLTFKELTDLSDDILEKISDIEGIETISATAGGNSTMALMGGDASTVTMYILLDPESGVTGTQVKEEIAKRTEGMSCEVSTNSSSMDATALFGSGLSIQVKGPDIDGLQKLATEVAKVLEQTEGTVDVNDGLDEQVDQLTITVDKEKAAKYGQTVAQVFQLVYAKMANSTSATTISTDIKDYEVYLQTEDQSEAEVEDIRNLTFTYKDKEGNEEEIRLDEICTLENTKTLSQILRDGQARYLNVSCGISEDNNVTLVSDEVKKKLEQLDIPEGYTVAMKGEDETINDAMGQMMLMLLLAVIFIYLIMVAQFQSLLSPFIIMFSIPLAFTGGFFALYITKQEVGVIAMLGFIMLAGLIVNNGIVLIDYINQARQDGLSKAEAIIEAAQTRVRPILMTVLTTILAMSTSALGMGEGSEIMQPMAITIIGGLLYGTVLTLIVIPCIYDAFHKEKSMIEEDF